MDIARILDAAIKLFLSNNFEEAKEEYEKALQIAQSRANLSKIANIYGHICLCLKSQSKWDEAIEYGEMALDISRKNNLKYYIGHSLFHLASVYYYRTQIEDSPNDTLTDCYTESIELLDQSLEIFEGMQNVGFQQRIYNMQGIMHFRFKEFDKAIESFLSALKSIEKLSAKLKNQPNVTNIGIKLRLYKNIADCFQALKQFDRAVEHYNAALSLANTASQPFLVGTLYNDIAHCHWYLGDFEESLECFRSANYYLSNFPNSPVYFKSVCGTFEVALKLEKYELAFELLGVMQNLENQNEDENVKNKFSMYRNIFDAMHAKKRLFVYQEESENAQHVDENAQDDGNLSSSDEEKAPFEEENDKLNQNRAKSQIQLNIMEQSVLVKDEEQSFNKSSANDSQSISSKGSENCVSPEAQNLDNILKIMSVTRLNDIDCISNPAPQNFKKPPKKASFTKKIRNFFKPAKTSKC